MDGGDGALWFLPAVGALGVLGGLFLIRQLLSVGKLERALDELAQVAAAGADRGRDAWMLAGAALVAGTGWALLALCGVIVHQMLYFIRQRRRELVTATDDGAAEARPAPTINAYFFSLVIAVLTAWMAAQGKMW